MGPGKPVPKALLGREVHFGPPLDWVVAHATFNADLVCRLELWTVQYALVQPALALAHAAMHGGLLASFLGDPGWHPPLWAERLHTAVYLGSTTLSLSALVGFFHTFEADLAKYAPLAKLLCVKGTVALCFYQSLVAAWAARRLGLGGSLGTAAGLLDLAVCVEMGVAAFVFAHAFAPSPPPARAKAE